MNNDQLQRENEELRSKNGELERQNAMHSKMISTQHDFVLRLIKLNDRACEALKREPPKPCYMLKPVVLGVMIITTIASIIVIAQYLTYGHL